MHLSKCHVAETNATVCAPCRAWIVIEPQKHGQGQCSHVLLSHRRYLLIVYLLTLTFSRSLSPSTDQCSQSPTISSGYLFCFDSISNILLCCARCRLIVDACLPIYMRMEIYGILTAATAAMAIGDGHSATVWFTQQQEINRSPATPCWHGKLHGTANGRAIWFAPVFTAQIKNKTDLQTGIHRGKEEERAWVVDKPKMVMLFQPCTQFISQLTIID